MYGRSTEVNRDLLYQPDEHLKRDAEFPPSARKGSSGAANRTPSGNAPEPGAAGVELAAD
jgi:hypothetical protein